MKLTLLGYLPKEIVNTPEFRSGWRPTELASVSCCIARPPAGWIDRWQHNDWGFFDDPEVAWSLVPRDDRQAFRLYAYAMYPVQILGQGEEERLELRSPGARPLTDDFRPLGWDAVSRSMADFFECSPLSCNLLADDWSTNAWCLLDRLEDALALARAAEDIGAEPGPYYVFQVWRRDA